MFCVEECSEAETIVQDIVNDIIKDIFVDETNGKETEDVNKTGLEVLDAQEATESLPLASALENLTEESAKVIFGESQFEAPIEISNKASQIIANFLGNDTRPATPPQQKANTLVNIKNLDEVTFSSDDSQDEPPLNINWENIESRPSSVNSQQEPGQQKNHEDTSEKPVKSTKSRIMHEVVDEFLMVDDDDKSAKRSENDSDSQTLSSGSERQRGRRTKSKPRKKPTSPSPTPKETNKEDPPSKSKEVQETQKPEEQSEKSKKEEETEIAEDVEQIVNFLRETDPANQKKSAEAETVKSTSSDVSAPPSLPPQAAPATAPQKNQEALPNGDGEQKTIYEKPKGRRGKSKKRSNKKAMKRKRPEVEVAEKEKESNSGNKEPEEKTQKEPKPVEKVKEKPVEKAKERVFKPIQNWHKILKISSEHPLNKSTVDGIFKNVTNPYVPTVPQNTSQRCIDALSSKDLEQLNCPGCKDRFLLPTTFFQHIYRKSASILFKCTPCGISEGKLNSSLF